MNINHNPKRKVIHVHYPKDICEITTPSKSVFVYNSNLKSSELEAKQFIYISIFIQQLENLIGQGYNTIYFMDDWYNSFILKFIEQTIYYIDNNNIKLRIFAYSFTELPDFFNRPYFIIHKLPIITTKSQVAKKLLPMTSTIVGLIKDNDIVIKAAKENNKDIYNIYDSENQNLNIPLYTTLTAYLNQYHHNKRQSISELDEIVSLHLTPEMYLYTTSYTLKKSEFCFILQMPYKFTMNNIFNKKFIDWWECVDEIKGHAGVRSDIYTGFGIWKLTKRVAGWKVSNTLADINYE